MVYVYLAIFGLILILIVVIAVQRRYYKSKLKQTSEKMTDITESVIDNIVEIENNAKEQKESLNTGNHSVDFNNSIQFLRDKAGK